MSDMNSVVPSVIPPNPGAPSDVNQEALALETKKMHLRSIIKGGAGWFYWIAGLTLINTIMAMSGSSSRFVNGLMITAVVDYFASSLPFVGKFAAVTLDGLGIALFIFFGVFANRMKGWAFLAGFIVFTLDSILSLLTFSPITIIFHGIAL